MSRRPSVPMARQRMLKMVDALETSLDEDIQGLSWMSADTKKQAKVKLQAIRNKIGYPDEYRDYSAVVIKRDDLLGNVQRADEFESKRQIAKIDKPLDRKEWGMTPPEVNAYYNGSYQRDRVSGGHFAASVLRQEHGRRGELRRNRAGDWPRTHARVRRSGAEVRSNGKPARLVDRAGWKRIRKARELCGG